MAKSRKDCLDDIAKKLGREREEVQGLADEILDRAESYEQDGMSSAEAYRRARDEMLDQIAEKAALNRRAEILNTRKDVERGRFYADVAKQLQKLPGISEKYAKKLATRAPRIAMEAKLVGVNLPFFKNRMSVDAQYVALRRLWVGGFAKDLEDAGLLKIFASRHLEEKWTDELFELNRKDGRPGFTKDAQALAIAKAVQKWQKAGMAALNREGAWVRSYSGYITRSSHDADAIRRAGPEKWVSDIINDPEFDAKQTFGTMDRARARDALREMWTSMKDGNHFDYGRTVDEPLYPNVAGQASASKEIHWKSGLGWRRYNEKYGVHNATHTVVQALTTGARRTALMKEFGTKPREAFERDLNYLKATLQAESRSQTSRLDALDEALRSPALDEKNKARIEGDMAKLRQQIDDAAGKFGNFESWDQALKNRFAQIDGSSQRPINRALANTVSNWMSIQRMAKLGRVALTHFASLPTKAMELRYWGVPLGDRYASLFHGLTQGAEGSAKRQALDATLVAFENRLGHMMNLYDVADAPAGYLAQAETVFFKLTGVSSVIDNQRGDTEALFGSYLGGKRGQAWADIGRKEQRVLQGFGIGEAEWKALHGVDWTKIGDRTFLFPPDALKLSDKQVTAYLKEAKARELNRQEPTADDIAKGRDDLATTIAAAYSDRAGYAIPMPSARIRAILFGKNFEPGTGINAALKLLYQFKIWPADMVTRAWEREIYGTIGDGRMDKIAGLTEAAVGAIIFGVASEGVRELIQGKDPLHKIKTQPIAAILAGAERSGFGSLIGDYLLGQYDRHGFSAVASLAGPTFSQIDTLMGILHGEGDSILNTAFGLEGEHKGQHPWRSRATSLIKLARDNIPFMNLWATSLAVNTLVWHRLQEAINPGYLQRSERRQRDQQGTHFWLSPSKADQMVTGKRSMFGADGRWNLGN